MRPWPPTPAYCHYTGHGRGASTPPLLLRQPAHSPPHAATPLPPSSPTCIHEAWGSAGAGRAPRRPAALRAEPHQPKEQKVPGPNRPNPPTPKVLVSRELRAMRNARRQAHWCSQEGNISEGGVRQSPPPRSVSAPSLVRAWPSMAAHRSTSATFNE